MSESGTREPGAPRLAVLGSPIAHSRSPRIHRAAHEALGLEWRYSAIRCGETALRGFLRSRGPAWLGFSVTMPLKEEALRVAATLDPVARESGVVNTLRRLPVGAADEPEASPRWAGFNTDVAGLARAIVAAGFDPARTVVLGAGATAVSAALAARDLGAERVTVLARRLDPAAAIRERFHGTASPGSDPIEVRAGQLGAGAAPVSELRRASLVISTLPGSAGAALALPDALDRVPLLDVAYDPWPSPLAIRARACGGVAHSGLDMLVEQALIQLRIFVHGDPGLPLDDEDGLLAAMRAAGMGG